MDFADVVARRRMVRRYRPDTVPAAAVTRIVDATLTVDDLMKWRKMKVHDPINGEYASREIIITPDDGEVE